MPERYFRTQAGNVVDITPVHYAIGPTASPDTLCGVMGAGHRPVKLTRDLFATTCQRCKTKLRNDGLL